MKRISILGLLIASIIAASCCGVHATAAYVFLSVTGKNVNVRAEAKMGGKILIKANPGDIFIAEDNLVTNPADGSKWYKIIMSVGDNYRPLSADKRFGVNAAYVSASFARTRKPDEGEDKKIAELLADKAPAATGDSDKVSEGGTLVINSLKILPNMNNEAGIREYLVGEWYFLNTSDRDYYSCRMVIGEDLNAKFEFFNALADESKESIGHFTGQFSFDRIYTGAHEAPDLLCLELPPGSNQLGGDYLFLHRTVFDKRCVMSLFGIANGGCLLDLLDPSGLSEWGGACPDEMVFIKETGEEYDLVPRANAEFYAICWGYSNNPQENAVWFDDINWPPPPVPKSYDPLYDGESLLRYLKTKYENETPISVAYAMADGFKMEGDGSLQQGEVYLVNTNERSEIIKISKISR
jgi:hypothetical protein